MSPHVTFETDFFMPLPGEEAEANPGCYGQALALWLSDQLVNRGVSVQVVLPEDFGWVVATPTDPPASGSSSPQAERLWLQRIFCGPDPLAPVQELWSYVQVLVPTIPGLRAVTWTPPMVKRVL